MTKRQNLLERLNVPIFEVRELWFSQIYDARYNSQGILVPAFGIATNTIQSSKKQKIAQ